MNAKVDFDTAKSLPDVDLLEFINNVSGKLLEKKVAVSLRSILANAGILDPGSDLQVIRLGVILAITADIGTIPYFERRSKEVARVENLADGLGLDPKWVHRGTVAADEIEQVLEKSLAS